MEQEQEPGGFRDCAINMLPDVRTLGARVKVEMIHVLNQWVGVQINEEVERVEIDQIAAESFVTRMFGEDQETR